MDQVKWAALLSNWTKGSGSFYVRLSQTLRGHIQSGHLAPWELLPAERSLAAQLGISRSTVVTAYDLLAAENWIVRQRGSGTRVARTAPRTASLLTLRSPSPYASELGEIDLTIAVPYLTQRHQERLQAAAAHAFEHSMYFPPGLPELRLYLAWMYTAQGLETTPEQVIVTSGAQQAISLVATALLRSGDSVVLETPTYFGAIDVFRATGAELRGVPVGAEGVTAEDFFAAVHRVSPRLAFLTPTFQNPTGSVMPERARQRIAQLCQEQQLPLIEDDSLIDLSFGPLPSPRIATFAPNAPVLNVGSLSKVFWAGLRVGWLRMPASLCAQLTQHKTLADFGTSLPSQVVALSLLQELDAIKDERRELLTPERDRIVTLLRQHLPEWSFEVPSGGQFLWLRLPTDSATAFTHLARRYGVRLFPGTAMSVGAAADNTLRLPFTLPPEQLEEAVLRLARAWQEFALRQPLERLA